MVCQPGGRSGPELDGPPRWHRRTVCCQCALQTKAVPAEEPPGALLPSLRYLFHPVVKRRAQLKVVRCICRPVGFLHVHVCGVFTDPRWQNAVGHPQALQVRRKMPRSRGGCKLVQAVVPERFQPFLGNGDLRFALEPPPPVHMLPARTGERTGNTVECSRRDLFGVRIITRCRDRAQQRNARTGANLFPSNH